MLPVCVCVRVQSHVCGHSRASSGVLVSLSACRSVPDSTADCDLKDRNVRNYLFSGSLRLPPALLS